MAHNLRWYRQTQTTSVLELIKLSLLQTLLSELGNICKITHHTVYKSHWGVLRNERADQLAKEDATVEQLDVPVKYHQKRRVIRSIQSHHHQHETDWNKSLFCDSEPDSMDFTAAWKIFNTGKSAMCTCGFPLQKQITYSKSALNTTHTG